MGSLPESRLLRFVEWTIVLARYAVTRFSTRYSRKRFTLRQHVALLCVKVKKATTYHNLVEKRIEMPRIRDALSFDSILTPSTLCKAFDLDTYVISHINCCQAFQTIDFFHEFRCASSQEGLQSYACNSHEDEVFVES